MLNSYTFYEFVSGKNVNKIYLLYFKLLCKRCSFAYFKKNKLQKKQIMKKTIIAFSLLACTASQSFAQKQSADNSVKFGVKAGANLATFTIKPSDEDNFDSKIGISAGAFASIPVGEGFSIQPEVLFSGMGAKQKDGTDEVKYLLNYISVPVLAKFTIPDSKFSVYAGPQFSLLVSSKAKAGSESVDLKDVLKNNDVSGVFGLQYEIAPSVNISTRYQLGFTNIAKDESDGTSIKNNALNFTIGYTFGN